MSLMRAVVLSWAVVVKMKVESDDQAVLFELKVVPTVNVDQGFLGMELLVKGYLKSSPSEK